MKSEIIENQVLNLIQWLRNETELSLTNWNINLKKNLTLDKLETIKKELLKFGKIQDVSNINELENSNFTIQIKFELSEYFVNFRFDHQNKLKGLFFFPNNYELREDIKLPSNIIDIAEEITSKIGSNKEFLIDSSMLIPLHKTSAMMVMVQGSGALDKNENVGNCAPFFDIAVNLVKNNIASIRFDKRTWVYPFLNMKDPEEEIINDAVLAANLAYDQLKKNDIPVVLLGHSQGALFLAKIAEKLKYTVSGFILLAPPADNDIHNRLIYQLNYLSGKNPELHDIYLKKIKEVTLAKRNWEKCKKSDSNICDFDDNLIFNKAGEYLKYLESYDPIEEFNKINIPIFVLQGGKDYNVLPNKDFLKWKNYVLKSNNRKSVCKLYPHLNHFFYNEDEVKSFNYVESIVIKDIVDWVECL